MENKYAMFSSDPAVYNKQYLKEQLIILLIYCIRERGWSQKDVAKALKVSQPRISALMTGKAHLFSLDFLFEKIFLLDPGLSCTLNLLKGRASMQIRLMSDERTSNFTGESDAKAL